MKQKTNKTNSDESRAVANDSIHSLSPENMPFVDNRSNTSLKPSQLKFISSGNNQVMQREYATATASAAGSTSTKTSKNAYSPNWVTAAMNQIASVRPKKIRDDSGVEKTVDGNAKFQCAEPKSLSSALKSGLGDDEKITKSEVDGIKLKDIKWCTGDRDGQAACLCPTCATWLEEDGAKGKAKPISAAKNKVKEIGESKGLYFESDESREKQREKEKTKADERKNYGVYIDIIEKFDDDIPYHEMRDLINKNREQFENYLANSNKIEKIKIEILGIFEEGDSRQKKKARDQKAECEKKITSLKSEQTKIILALGLPQE